MINRSPHTAPYHTKNTKTEESSPFFAFLFFSMVWGRVGCLLSSLHLSFSKRKVDTLFCFGNVVPVKTKRENLLCVDLIRVFDRCQNNCYFDSAVKNTNMPQNKFSPHRLVLTDTIEVFLADIYSIRNTSTCAA